MRPIAVTLISLSAALLIAAPLHSAESNPARRRPTAEPEAAAERFIVKLRGTAAQSNVQIQANASGESAATLTAMTQRVQSLASRARVSLDSMRALSPTMHMMKVRPLANGETAAEMLARLRADADVEYAVPDRRVYLHATVPTDPRYLGQWYLQNVEVSSINATGAWDITKGSAGTVIAVVDTGVRFDHEDLKAGSVGGKLLPGYDFISGDSSTSFFTANDGNGRDADASDPGDFVTAADATAHTNCDAPSNGSLDASSWHGTRVSGIIGALTDNGVGVAGIDWNAWILPVRVIGKCGGFNSDVVAGIRWAAGLHVPGVPDNTTPARVINVSLGGSGGCDSPSADTISEVSSSGALVVVSAGNEGGPVDSPANCPGAAAILGLRHAGTKVGFSSLGPEITVGAPGGNCINTTGGPCLFSIDTTSNTGTTTPGTSTYTDQNNFNVGTSFSAPIVSGIAGLMLAVNGNLKSSQLIARLKEGAKKPFPTTSDTGTPPVCHAPASAADIQNVECSCTTAACGAGMANALGSVNAALRPIAAVVVPGSVSGGSNVTLRGDGSAAACNHTIATYAWTVVASSGTAPTIMNANTATATVPAPTSGTTTVRLTVTDDAGKQDTADVTISSTTAVTAAPANAGSTACLAAIVVPQGSQVSVVATDTSALEAGSGTGTFTFTRTGDVSAELSVVVAMSGTATNGTDYATLAGNVAFAAGQATTTSTITPIDDALVEGSETATVTVLAGTGYNVGNPSVASVTITDNDTAAPPPTSPSTGGGGGGGALDWITLLVSFGAVVMVLRVRVRERSEALLARQRAALRSAFRR